MEKKLKIGLLSYYNGVLARGAETYVHELANKLSDLGHDVTVYQNGKRLADTKYKTVSIGVNFTPDREGKLGLFLNRFLGNFALSVFTRRALSKVEDSTEIVVAVNNKIQCYLCRLWTKRNKVKLVISGQSGPGFDERVAIWSFPDLFIPLTKKQKRWVQKANPFLRVSEVIPNGVDLDKFKKGVKPIELNLPKPIILCSAAFWTFMKRQDLLIKAVAKTNASLLLAGSGEDKQNLEEMGEKYLGDRFKIMSFPHHQMPSVYAAVDLFSFPTSEWESFGIVLAEAMASGLGIVATKDPYRKEIVADAGILVDPTDTKAYADALKKALKMKWETRARKQAEKFSWEIIAKSYEKEFLKLLGR